MYRPDVCRPIEPKPMRPRKGMDKTEDQERRPPVCVRPHPEKPMLPKLGK